jgi:hypothetical protein
MKVVVSLFPDEKAAAEAVSAVEKAEAEAGTIELYTEERIKGEVNVRPLPGATHANAGFSAGATPAGGHPGPGTGAVLSDDSIESFLQRKGVDTDAKIFFRQGMKDGGAFVFVNPKDDDSAKKIQDILSEKGGTALQESI